MLRIIIPLPHFPTLYSKEGKKEKWCQATIIDETVKSRGIITPLVALEGS
ncbi:MAG: hypothetical protein HQ517_02205 [SAR324 cluster bacterium]|nr:hypothetical protein [SAR324 cluster bacterium]